MADDNDKINEKTLNPDDGTDRTFYSNLDDVKKSESEEKKSLKEDIVNNSESLNPTRVNELNGSTNIELNTLFIDSNEKNEKELKHNEVIGVYKPLDDKSKKEQLLSDLRQQTVDSITSNFANMPSMLYMDTIDALGKDQFKQIATFNLFSAFHDEFPAPSYRVDVEIQFKYNDSDALNNTEFSKKSSISHYFFTGVSFPGFGVNLSNTEYAISEDDSKLRTKLIKQNAKKSFKPLEDIVFGFASWESLLNQAEAWNMTGQGNIWEEFKDFMNVMNWVISKNRKSSSGGKLDRSNAYLATIDFHMVNLDGNTKVSTGLKSSAKSGSYDLRFVFEDCIAERIDVSTLTNTHTKLERNAPGGMNFVFKGNLCTIARFRQSDVKPTATFV